jgi:uncharacterized protein YacL
MYYTMSHLLQAFAATGAIIAAEIPHGVDTTDWIQMVERLGLAVALVIFFVVTGWKREQRMAKRLDWLEKENDKLSMRTITLGEQVNQALLVSSTVVSDTLRVLEGRMCWAFKSREEFEAVQKSIQEKKT